MKKVFECRTCGQCCRGEGGIFLTEEEAPAAAAELGVDPDEFLTRYTEPRHNRRMILSGPDGWCLLHDRDTHRCRIHAAKPRMCRDWPFFHGMLDNREGFEAAKNNCPGIPEHVTWEEFTAWFDENAGRRPPRSYILVEEE